MTLTAEKGTVSGGAEVPPRVSVIMAAYNAERTVVAAVRSILSQTMPDFEIIAVDDCSSDDTYDILRRLAAEDPRMRIVRNTQRRERAWSRNRAAMLARSELIAVLDADDLALPHRLELQACFLERNPAVVLLGGSGYEMDDRTGALYPYSSSGAENDQIRTQMRRSNPFSHSSVMFRKAAAMNVGLYDPATLPSEDQDLFWRLLSEGSAHILAAPLVLVRMQWERERHLSRARRVADVRTRWRGVRSRRSTLGDWLCLVPGALRLAVPSGVDVRLRRVKRVMQDTVSIPEISEWIRACESGERPAPGLLAETSPDGCRSPGAERDASVIPPRGAEYQDSARPRAR